MLTRSNLRRGQLFFDRVILSVRRVLLVAKMASGKTGAVLYSIRKLLDGMEVRKVLVVAPIRVAENTWPDEIKGWDFSACLSFSVLTGTVKQREAAAREDTEIHIINRENLPWLWRFWGDKFPYDMLVYDESSRMKRGKKRTEGTKKNGRRVRRISEFGALNNMRRFFKLIVEMSGTPAPNGLIDLWGPIYILDGGERLGKDRAAFERRWFDSDYMGWKLTPREGAFEEITDKLKDVMVGLRPEDHVDMPPLITNNVMVHLPKKLMADYRNFERTLVLEKHNVEAVSKGVLVNKLLQFSNGSVYRWKDADNPKAGRETVHLHDQKIKGLESVIEEAAGEPVLIAYSFKFDVERIRKRYPDVVIFDDEPDAVRLWNEGKISKLLAHPASMAHGLNMQFGGNIAVWYGLTWSRELYEQFNARLPRPGSASEHVYLHHILAAGTYDMVQFGALNAKGATQDSITAVAQAYIENLRMAA